ncbi:MAG: hypothetical protein UT17_C0005G0006 [Candidatus Woesebacteria bacterium GW2011_GWB1_39_10]|uniref:Uncharacterized protein n=1 Tax=Candidatus Woesebacteria bacterium GW2011_GWB1_39_10 TaxID=1618572 RepID=A0A0G0PQC5_9BACT|nr:MAG: hypothetical protein UT17_C0005G0006 [Candidatus Woesebacteria bacterium GW2011_GWB1_39_10]
MPISFYISDLIALILLAWFLANTGTNRQKGLGIKVFHTSIFSLTFALLLAWAMYI